jgi:hypothetical protein
MKILPLRFRRLKKALRQHFIKINNINISSPFYAISLFDLVEISYRKIFEHFFTKKQIYLSSFFQQRKRKKKKNYFFDSKW